MTNYEVKRERIEMRRDTLKVYSRMKFEEEDWHGAIDALMELTALDAEKRTVKELEELEIKILNSKNAQPLQELS